LNYDAVLLKGKNLFSTNSGNQQQLILVSDFQTKETAFTPTLESLISLHAVQLKPVNSNNLSIGSLYISNKTPLNIELTAHVSNQEKTLKNIPISLFNNKNLIAKTAIDIEQNATAVFTVNNEE